MGADILLKILAQSVDRAKMALSSRKRSSVRHRPYTTDYSPLTRPEYLDHPELFYRKPDPVKEVKVVRTERVKGFHHSYLTFPSPQQTPYPENNTAYGVYTTAEASGPAEWALVVLHGWGREHFKIEKKMCLTLAAQGISSLLLTLPFHQQRAPAGSWSGEYMVSGDVVRTAESFQQTIAEVQAMIPWLRQRSRRVGIFGMSLGGILAHLAMTVEPFDAGITLLAGGNSTNIVWEGRMTRYVREDIQRAGITREQLEQIWLATTPTNLAPWNLVKRLLMINGRFDEVVPVKYTLELWEALGKPPLKWYPCAHYTAYFFLRWILRDIVEFLKK